MRSYLIIALLSISFLACKKGIKGNPEIPGSTVPVAPDMAVQSFPEQNGVCITGTGTSLESNAVIFKWNAAKNAVQYELSVKNLKTGDMLSGLTTNTELSMTISKGTPYSWFVTSRSKEGLSAQSSSWKFYNAGNGILSYPPFPADELSPAIGTFVTPVTGTIELSWKGSDPDNDLLNYDVYFGTVLNPPLLGAAVTGVKIERVAVIAKTRYYWKVVSRDRNGNTSTSDVIQFSTN